MKFPHTQRFLPRVAITALAVGALTPTASAQQGGTISIGIRYPHSLGAFSLELDTARSTAVGLGFGFSSDSSVVISALAKQFLKTTQGGPYVGARFDTRLFEDNYALGVIGYRADIQGSFVDLEGGYGRRFGISTGDTRNVFTVGAQIGMRF